MKNEIQINIIQYFPKKKIIRKTMFKVYVVLYIVNMHYISFIFTASNK